MNYLVFLDSQASELEKILSGTKSMVLKEFDPASTASLMIRPGDDLYFLRDQNDSELRVKATVIRVLLLTCTDEDLSHTLKEMQPRLQLTEDQYNHWSVKGQILLVEFSSAHKIVVAHISLSQITNRARWIAFEELSLQLPHE